MFTLDLEKTEKPEIKLPTSVGSLKKQESSRKTSVSVLLTMPKPLTVWITINCGKFLKRCSIGSHRVRHYWSDLACMHALEKKMATHSSILAWRIPGTEEPGGLPSMGSHRVRHNWSNLAAAAAAISVLIIYTQHPSPKTSFFISTSNIFYR